MVIIAKMLLQVNTSTGGADSLVTALCMKNVADWMALGASHGGER